MPFQEPEKKYKTVVCLEHETSYRFVLIDNNGDGLCCGHGNGSYTLRDSNKDILFQSGDNNDESFHIKEFDFETGPAPSGDSDDGKKKKKCKNKKKGKFRLKRNKGEKRNCKQHAADGNCDEDYKGKPLWKSCKKACGRCEND